MPRTGGKICRVAAGKGAVTGSVVAPPGSRRLDALFVRRPVAEPVGDDEKLTQFGFAPAGFALFRSVPQPPGSREMSMIRGRVVELEAGRLVGHEGRPELFRARYTTAGMLRSKGFRVEHTPTLTNPHHVSVVIDDDVWTEATGAMFNECFAL